MTALLNLMEGKIKHAGPLINAICHNNFLKLENSFHNKYRSKFHFYGRQYNTFSTMSPATPRTTSNRLLGEKSSGIQNATSLYVGGYLLKGLNSEILFSSNCERNRGSSLQNSRISGMLKSFMARRSSPIPKAHPIFCPAPPTWKKIQILLISM